MSEYDVFGGKEGYMKESRAQWRRASGFPANKELVYPEHVIAQEFDSHRDKLVLEFGCGNGTDGISYLKRGNTVVMCDIVPENIANAEKNVGSLAENAHFQLLEEGASLPFASDEFDVVNMHGVMMHIIEPEPVVRELKRVLHPDGVMYVMLYTEFLYERGREHVERWMAEGLSEGQAFGRLTDGEGTPYARYYTEEQGREFFTSLGFEVISVYVYNNDDFRTFKLRKLS